MFIDSMQELSSFLPCRRIGIVLTSLFSWSNVRRISLYRIGRFKPLVLLDFLRREMPDRAASLTVIRPSVYNTEKPHWLHRHRHQIRDMRAEPLEQ